MKRVEMFCLPTGKVPTREWLESLDPVSRRRIYSMVDRVALGGSKANVKALGGSIFEIKIDHGPGFRLYFGEADNVMILLLLGGDKSSQRRDIEQARMYWRQYVSQR